MMDRGIKYLSDILRAIELIELFVSDTSSFEDYQSDTKTQSAVERQLGIIGEAVNKYNQYCPDDKLDHTRQIVGLRNRIIHAYDSIDDSIVWVIVNRYLTPLKKEVESKAK